MDNKSLLRRIYEKNKLRRLLTFAFGLLLVAVSYNIFSKKCNLVYGVSGIALMLNKALFLDTSISILTFNALLLLVSLFTLGEEKTKKTVLGSLLFPLLVKITEPVGSIELGNIENILLVICGALLTGFGHGLIFKTGYTTGGTDILNQIVSKYGKMSVGKAMYFTDLVIITFSILVFGYSTFIYSVLNLYIISLMTDKVILGISQSKAFYIITEHETDVKRFITQNLSHGITVLEARGGYTGNMQKVIMCIVPTKEYYIFKEGIQMIDKDAFFIVTDAYEVSGGK